MLKTHNLILTYHIIHDLIIWQNSEKSESNQKNKKHCLQAVNNVKRLTDDSMIAFAISFVQTLIFLSNRVFVCVNQTPDPDFSKSVAANSESISNAILIIRTNINHVYISIYTDYIIILWLYNSHEYHIFKTIHIQAYYINIKSWRITYMLIYQKRLNT